MPRSRVTQRNMKALLSCLALLIASLPALSFAESAPVLVPEFRPERLGGFSCRTDGDPTGIRVVARILSDSTIQLSVYERFSQIASVRVAGTVSFLAQGDWVFSSTSYGLVVSSKSEVRELVNGDKIRLFPAEFLGVLSSRRSVSGPVLCVALARR